MWKKIGICWCMLAFLLSEGYSDSFSKAESIVISKADLTKLIESMQLLKQDLVTSKLNFKEAQTKQKELVEKAELLSIKLAKDSAESTALLNELTDLKQAFDDYKKAVKLQIEGLELFPKVAIPVGVVMAVTIVALAITHK